MIKFENKENGRFYYVSIENDLLHNSVLRITYGGKQVCRSRVIGFENNGYIQKEIVRISKKRIKRGYSLVT
jgi:predicted DNA-binding WGR domain protein